MTPRDQIKALITEVAGRHGLTYGDIVGCSTRAALSLARDEAVWRLREMRWACDGGRRFSYPQIAAFVGMTDHSSAWSAYQRHAARVVAAMREAA